VEVFELAVRADHDVSSGDHVVQFYAHDAELLGAVVPYLADGLRAGEAVIVIATEAHRRALEASLAASGIDVGMEKGRGAFASLDAAEAITAFASDGAIDREVFGELVGGLLRQAAKSGRALRAYGEMVSLLWDAGDVLCAIELETLWNELRAELGFSLFCSYRSVSVIGAERADALQQLCKLHSTVLAWPTDALRGERVSDEQEVRRQMIVEADFPADAGAPGRARRRVVEALRERQLAEDVIDDAALVVSELASNAVRHAGSSFSVAVALDTSSLSLAVSDARPLERTNAARGLPASPLHGLGVIDAISLDWGTEGTSTGKVVWVELACSRARFASVEAG
jgi:MEDS: MEthanogen/methylotroph, DcmR Sensory domain/Histidine kinase-like ATPase domain